MPDLVWKYTSDSKVSLSFRLAGPAGLGYVGYKEGEKEFTWYSKRVFFKDQATLTFGYPASKFDEGTYSCEFSARDRDGRKQEITSYVARYFHCRHFASKRWFWFYVFLFVETLKLSKKKAELDFWLSVYSVCSVVLEMHQWTTCPLT